MSYLNYNPMHRRSSAKFRCVWHARKTENESSRDCVLPAPELTGASRPWPISQRMARQAWQFRTMVAATSTDTTW